MSMALRCLLRSTLSLPYHHHCHQRLVSSAAASPGLFELRTYSLPPERADAFIEVTNRHRELRKKVLPLLGMWKVEIGGKLSTVKHLYHFKSLDERTRIRKALAQNADWGLVQAAMVRDHGGLILDQHSEIFSEAPEVMAAAGFTPSATVFKEHLEPLVQGEKAPGCYEYREYQLIAGYGSMGVLRNAFEKGLGSKVAADTVGKLAFFGYTEFGRLNKAIEIWRYPSLQACLDGRKAARVATEWRHVIADVAPVTVRFDSKILIPIEASPWQ